MSTNDFTARITRLQSEINALKSAIYRPSFTTPTETKTITVYPELTGISYSGGAKSAVPISESHIEIDIPEGGFAGWSIATDSSGRKFLTSMGANSNGNIEIVVYVGWGNDADIEYLNGDSTKRLAIPIELKIVVTNEATITSWNEEQE